MRNIFADHNYPPLDRQFRYMLLAYILLLYAAYSFSVSKYENGKIFHLNSIIWLFVILAYISAVVPLFSIDLYEYVIRGRLFAIYGMNPFLVTPDAIPQDPLYPVIFWKSTVTTYGPLWNIISYALVRISGSSVTANLISFKACMLFFHILTGYFIYLLAKNIDRTNRDRITFLFLLNPYIAIMNLMENHNDIVMVSFLIISLYLLSKKKYVLCTAALSLSVGAKYVTVLFFPLILIYIYKERTSILEKVSFSIRAVAVNSVIFFALWAPFNMGPSAIIGSIQTIKTRLDTNSLPYLTYSLISLIMPDISTARFRQISDVIFISSTLGIYALFALSKRNSVKELINMCLIIFAVYFATVSFQFGSWYIIWLAPLVLFSGLPKKNFFFLLITLAALISFWKRISFLLAMSVLAYLASIVLIKRNFLPEKLRYILD